MTEVQAAWLELATVGGMGAILALVGGTLKIAAKRRSSLCTEQTAGKVVRHGFNGEGGMYPVVEYAVNGIRYQARKKFRGVKTVRISGLPLRVQPQAYEDEKGWLHVKIGPIANLRPLAEQLWPLGSSMTVYYDPANPKKCYVDRPILGGFASTMFVLMGLGTLILGVLLFFLMQT